MGERYLAWLADQGIDASIGVYAHSACHAAEEAAQTFYDEEPCAGPLHVVVRDGQRHRRFTVHIEMEPTFDAREDEKEATDGR